MVSPTSLRCALDLSLRAEDLNFFQIHKMEFSRPAMKVLSLGKGTFGLGGDLKSRIMLSVYNQSSNNGTNQQHTLSKDSNDSGQKEKFSSRLKFVQQVPNCINNLQNLQNRTSRFGIPLDTLETLSSLPLAPIGSFLDASTLLYKRVSVRQSISPTAGR